MMTKYIKYILIAIILIGTGIVIGISIKNEPKTITKIEYLPGETIQIEVPVPYPVKEIIPADTSSIIKTCVEYGLYKDLFPEKIKDSLIYITTIDTTKVFNDWVTKRSYKEELFNIDSLGNCTFSADVQYNRLSNLKYDYNPVIKYHTDYIYKEKKVSPFIGIGFMSRPSIIIKGGMFFKEDWGFDIIYEKDFMYNKNIFGASVLYKF